MRFHSGVVASADGIYVSVDGNDGNSGRSPAHPLATFAAAVAQLAEGQVLYLDATKRFQQPTLEPLVACHIRPYNGARVAIGSDVSIDAGDITAHATHSNVYEVVVTHQTAMSMIGSTLPHSAHPGMWEEAAGELTNLTLIRTESTIAANAAEVAATPGSFTVHVEGSSTADIYDEEGSFSELHYIFHLADSGDPRSNGSVMHYAENRKAFRLQSGSSIQYVDWGWNADKDAAGFQPQCSFGNTRAIDVARHGSVGLCTPVGPHSVTARLRGAGGHVWYRANTSVPPDFTDILVANFSAENIPSVLYSHGSGGEEAILKTFNAQNITATNFDYLMRLQGNLDTVEEGQETGGELADSPNVVQDFTATLGRYFCYAGGMKFLNGSWTHQPGTSPLGVVLEGTAIQCLGNLELDNISMEFTEDEINRLFENRQAINDDDETNFVSLILKNVTKGGVAYGPTTTRARQVDLTLTGSNVGELCTFTTGGVQTTGPELITNGTFDSDISGWSEDAPTASWDAGTLLLSGGGARVYQAFATEIGKKYLLAGSCSGAALMSIRVGTHANGTQNLNLQVPARDYSEIFTATATTTYVTLRNGSDAGNNHDDVSCKAIEAIPPFRNLVARDSTFGLGGRSLAEIQALGYDVDESNTIL